jgi:hypothetical protein
MMDLNDFVPDDYADHLFTANDINNLGQITGLAVKAGTEEQVAVWMLPLEKRGHRDADEGAREAKNDTKRVPLPAQARQQVLARAFATEAQLR